MTVRPCPKCNVAREVIAVDSKGHEILEPCQTCRENLREKHITGSKIVEGNGEDVRSPQGQDTSQTEVD